MRKILLLLGILSVTLGAHAQSIFGGNWIKGEVTDMNGNKTACLINTYKPFTQIKKLKEKPDKDGESQTIEAAKIKSFTVTEKSTTDTFEVSHQEEFEDKPFFKLMLDRKTKLYNQNKEVSSPAGMPMGTGVSFGIGLSYTNNNYFTGPDVEHLTKMKRGDFKKTMSELLGDNAILVNEIKMGNFHYADMYDLIESYKTGVLKTPPVNSEDQ